MRAARLNHRPFGAWAPLESDGTLVADDGAPPSVVEEFKAAGRDVVVVPTGRGPADAG